MTSQRWSQVKQILGEAFERPLEDRATYLAKACGEDSVLRHEVEILLASEEEEWELFDAPPPGWPAPVEAAPVSAGTRVGPYEILREIGRGGMGRVYLSRRADDQFQKQVAIKLIRPGMAGDDALARFRTERQISAALEHPHIARLLDGGTTEAGEPYFVLEYVEGESLLEACHRRGLSLEERLRLFVTICGAVEYAHRNLVVHRDIKPSNILVTPEGEPKLLDFGIAKLLDPGGELPDRTATVLRVLTPDYASPEQVRGGAITTATDVYSLGIVLYELLSGRRPYHVESGEVGELLRVVCERDPARPSAAAEAGAESTTEEPDPEAGVLARRLRGDLDAIVMKAIRKEPQSRYGSVAELSDDVLRYLEARPVEARRGTLAYRAGKFVRRHRVGLLAAAVVGIALAGGVFATLREARRARIAEARAQRRFDDVRRLANSFLFEFHDAISDLPGSTPARALLVRRALEYLDGLSKESAGDPGLRRELAEAYQKVGDVEGNPYIANLGDLAGALRSYRKAIGLLEPVVAAGQATAEERKTLAAAYLTGGGIQLVAGDPVRAVAMSEKGLALETALAAREPGDAKAQMNLARAFQFHAFNLWAARRPAEASRALAEQEKILRARLRADPSDRIARRGLGQNLYLAGQQLESLGQAERALPLLQEAAGIQEALLASAPSSVQLQRDLLYLRSELGDHFSTQKEFRKALGEYERALEISRAMAAADPKNTDSRLSVAMSLQNTGVMLVGLGELPSALGRFAEAKALYEANFAPGSANAWAGGMLAALYVEAGETLDAARRKSGAIEPEVLRSLGSSCDLFRRSVAAFERLGASGNLLPAHEADFARARGAAARCSGSKPPEPGG